MNIPQGCAPMRFCLIFNGKAKGKKSELFKPAHG
jgi:hypothetical protein